MVVNIICSYNEVRYLPKVVQYYQREGIEVYVADNKSADGTWEWLNDNKIPCEQFDTDGCFDLVAQQKLRLKLIDKFSNKRKNLKKKIMDKSISIEERLKLQNKLNDLPRNSSNIRYRNRCKLTGRTRGVYRKFGLSRIKIRELSMSGDLPGMIKSSW